MASHQVRQPSGAEPRFFYGYIVVMVSTVVLVVIFAVHYSFGVFFKPMLNEFGWTRAMTSGAYSLSWILQGVSAIVSGGLTDRLGPRLVITLYGLLTGLGFLLTSQISTIWHLYLFYGVIVGIGIGGIFVPLTSTVARWFIARRNTMTGIVVAGVGIGTLVGAPVANQLISTYDWHVSYMIMGSIVLIVVVSAAQFLRRDPSKMGQVPYGYHESEEQGQKIVTKGLSLRESACTWQFWVVFAMFLSFGFCLYVIIVHIAPHATDLGISAASAANFLATIGAASIVGKVVMGNAGDRIGNKYVYVICFILLSASLFWLMSVTEVWMFYLFAIVFGFAYGGIATSMSPLVATLFGIRSLGLIFGATNNGFTIGATIGPFVAGYIFDVTSSYRLAFLLSGVIAALGLISTLALKPIRSEGGQTGSTDYVHV